MSDLVLHKREGLFSGEHVPDLVVQVSGELPSEAVGVYERDAARLMDALWTVLPGGTIDQLLLKLLERRAALLRVGFLSVDELIGIGEGRRGADVVR